MLGLIIGGIVGAVTAVGKALAVVGLAVEGLKKVGTLITTVGKALGLIPEKMETEEMGEKALQMDEKGEGFDAENETYKEYLQRIENFEIDPEKKHSEEENLKKGTEVACGVIIETYPDCSDLLIDTIKKGDNLKLSNEELEKYIKADGGEVNIGGFFNGSEKNPEIIGNTVNAIASIQKELDPAITDKDAIIAARRMQG